MELSQMFAIPEGSKTLPVTVTVGPNQFTHMLSAELLVFTECWQPLL